VIQQGLNGINSMKRTNQSYKHRTKNKLKKVNSSNRKPKTLNSSNKTMVQ